MSEFSVSFIETFIVQAASKDEAIAEAKSLYLINVDSFDFQIPNEVTCEIVPKLFKVTV
jgi:hypothetical protein